MKLRMIIAGGRNFEDYEKLRFVCSGVIRSMEDGLGEKFESIEIISGRANGADTLGERFAQESGYALKLFPADWVNLGKFAGYMRNEQMAKYAACVEEPDCRSTTQSVLCAFWDGRSRGTKNMIGFAHMYEFNNIMIDYYPAKGE